MRRAPTTTTPPTPPTSSTACGPAIGPSADLETIGHPSSLLCHFGNSAWRTGRTLRFNYDSYTFGGDAEANKYLVRPEHRKPWTLPTLSEV